MIVRLLLVVLVALAVSATATSASADLIVEVEVGVEVGETAGDVDEAQAVAGDAVLVTDVHPAPRSAPDVRAPVPPFCLGVFRPPRVAFD
jgi:hypothetical protein